MEIGIIAVIGIMGTFIHFALRDILEESKERNRLLEEQNELLKRGK